MKNFKKALSVLLVTVMLLTASPLNGFVGPDLPEIDFTPSASAATSGYYTYSVANGEATITDVNTAISGVITSPSTLGGYPVTSIGNSAFCYCDSLTSVTIPDSVTSIGAWAFAECASLTSVTIPDSVRSIGNAAFAECDSLTSVTIPDSVTSIGDGAFSRCTSLTSVTIPDSVTSIGDGAFSRCDTLTLINVDSNNAKYSSADGILYDKDKSALVCYPAGKRVKTFVIPDSVTSIGNFAFENCTSLTSVTIPDSVTNIGDSAFEDCASLTTVTIPDNVTSIGDDVFCGCRSLTSVTIPDSVTSIGDYAFFGCTSLTSVTIPDSVTSIGDHAFHYCTSLTSVTIGDSVTSIGNYAFYSCTSLTSVTIPDSVTSIGDAAFYDCASLKDVYYSGTAGQWAKISIGSYNTPLTNATIHYNCKLPQDSYFIVSSDQYSVDSISHKETATYKIHLLDENSDFLSVNGVTVQNNTTDIVNISTNKVSDTELELTVEPLKDGDASISLFDGDSSVEQFFNFTVYSNTTTYRADQVPVTNEKLKTNFSRGDMTVDNFAYKFDENEGKYIATMDVYNRSGAIGVVAAYTQDGSISAIEQVDPYIPLPGDFGEFLVYLGTGAVSIAKGENWNYRYSGYCQKTSIEIEVPEDGYLTVSCDVISDPAVMIYSFVSLGVETAFKTAEIIDYLGTDTDKLAKKASKTIVGKTTDYFNSRKGKQKGKVWVDSALNKLSKKMSKKFSLAYLEDISMLSFDLLEEMSQTVGSDFSSMFMETIDELIQEEIKTFGVMSVSKKLIKDKVIGVAERNFLKVVSAVFDGGEYINLANKIVGTYLYNQGTGKTKIVFEPKGENGFLCMDTIKVKTDIITDEVLLHTYVIKDTQKEDAFVRKTIYSDFNRGDGLRKEELSIDLNRIVEIHEISLWKNGQEVFDTFTATVKMSLPAYINKKTCSVYRVEKDGTYTKLDTRIEEGEIVFETDHFSEYILTGVIEDLQETTPCDVHVYEEVRTDPSCVGDGAITYTCYCGDTYTETITAPGHTEEIIPAVAATCTQTGLTEGKKCSVCGEILVAQTETPVVDHADTDADGLCDYCSEQLAPMFVIGDVDNNGKIESTDARLALRAAVKLETLTETQTKAADADKDGEITSSDARLILRAAVGLETL